MALTKLPKNAFGTGSVDDSKIEDGTIQNQEISGTLPEEKLATGTIENASLSNSTITINGTSVSLGGSSSVGVDVNWQSVITADGSTTTTSSAGNGYFIDTTSAAHTINLPASASLGDTIAIKDYATSFNSNNLTIGRNGHKIQGVNGDVVLSTNRASVVLVYVDSTKGWLFREEHNVGNLGAPLFTAATGGTITNVGDYKVHSFTGDGCFVVSQLGNSPTNPSGGPAAFDILVVAGGGQNMGGAGGFRVFPGDSSILTSATTYPVTVGAGGGGKGSNSVLSTITSAGGGQGVAYRGGPSNPIADEPDVNGGSGGGGGYYDIPGSSNPGGAGNTPPVSPPQGNPGGNSGFVYSGAGGGGAATAGSNALNGPGNQPGQPGGAGSPVTSIFGAAPQPFYPVPGPGEGYFAGGGGGVGFTFTPSTFTGGTGGIGGGGHGPGASNATPIPNPNGPPCGVANSGGGGGGGNGAGGKGIVLIRYKFQ
jgi:hypothetical protein